MTDIIITDFEAAETEVSKVSGIASTFESDLLTTATAWEAAGTALVGAISGDLTKAEVEVAHVAKIVGTLQGALAVFKETKTTVTQTVLQNAVSAVQNFVATNRNAVVAAARR